MRAVQQALQLMLYQGCKYDITRPESAMLTLADQEKSVNLIEVASSLL